MTSYQPLRLLRPLGVKTSSVSCQKISLFLSNSFLFSSVIVSVFLNCSIKVISKSLYIHISKSLYIYIYIYTIDYRYICIYIHVYDRFLDHFLSENWSYRNPSTFTGNWMYLHCFCGDKCKYIDFRNIRNFGIHLLFLFAGLLEDKVFRKDLVNVNIITNPLL